MPLTLKNFYKQPIPPLSFTANTAGSKVALVQNGTPTSVTLETSTDGETWSTYTFGTAITLDNIGDKVYFRNTSSTDTGFNTSIGNYYQFQMSGSINGGGDVTTLLNKNGTNTLSNYCFYALFQNCLKLKTAPRLPATSLAQMCYRNMFYGCSGLTVAPELPATTLAYYCYASMFDSCTGLTACPALPATTLEGCCYLSMFYGCTSIKTCPPLPVTTLYDSCYQQMFDGCSSLETLPKLPATALQNSCYYYMFRGCSKIKISSSQTGTYQTPYRIPTTGTGSGGNWSSLDSMFTNTGGTYTSSPSVNTTYYTSNTVV